MKSALLYVLSFLVSAALGFGGVFLFKQAGDKEPIKGETKVVQPVSQAEEQNKGAEPQEITDSGSAPVTETRAEEKPELSSDFVVLADSRQLADASGSNFNISGFSVSGSHGGNVEYVLRDQQGKFSQTSPDGSFSNVPSGRVYYISAVDVPSGKTSAEVEFKLSKIVVTAKEIEAVLNESDPDKYDKLEKNLTQRMPGYKIDKCHGCKKVTTISEVRDLFDNDASLKGKKAYVSKIQYSNKTGLIEKFEITLQ